MDIRFKPGIQTSLNSGEKVKKDIKAHKGGDEKTAVQNTTGQTAASNLSKTTELTSNDWNSANGSVFKSGKGFTIRGAVASSSSGGSKAIVRDKHYVSSGYWNKQMQQQQIRDMQIPTNTNYYGFSRGIGMNGSSRRSGLRAYEQMMGNNMAQQTTGSSGDSGMSSIANIALSAAALGGGIMLGKEIISGIGSLFKKNKSSSGGGNVNANGNTPAAASTSNNATIKKMEDAKTSTELGQAIDEANTKVKDIDNDISDAKANKAQRKAAKSGLKSAAKQERKEAKAATKEVETHRNNAAKYKQDAATAKGAIEGYTKKVKSNENSISTNEATIKTNRGKIGDINSQLQNLKMPQSPPADASAAEKAQYQKELNDYNEQKAELTKQKADLEKANEKLDKENDKLKEENVKYQAKIEKYTEEFNEATRLEGEENREADAAEIRAQKEEAEAKAAEDAVTINEGELEKASERLDDLKASRSEIKQSIPEHKDRYKEMKKDEIKKEK